MKLTILGALAVIAKDGLILMGKRRDPDRPDLDGLWEFPGGEVEFNERPEEGVIREVKEEVGLKVKVVRPLSYVIIKYDEIKPRQIRYVLFPYLCKIIGGEIKLCDEEVSQVRWIKPSEINPNECMPYTQEALKSMLE